MTTQNNAINLLRMQYKGAHDILEGTMQGLTVEQAQWLPPGKAHPIAANYGHVLATEDGVIGFFLQGTAPLMASAWAGKSGLSEPPPQSPPWDEWARRVQVDLAAAHNYAQAVYQATDNYLATLADQDLARPMDLAALGLGQQTLGFLLSLLLFNVHTHTGEIACLKGFQGLQGYPF